MSEYIIDFDEKSSAYMRILLSKTAMNKGEIVRCRDCKHYEDGMINGRRYSEPYCGAIGELSFGALFEVTKDDFCSWSERKSDAE